jgi:glucose/arabinose dehydrogenase
MRNVRRGRSPFVVVPIAIGLAAGLVWFVQRTEDTDWRPPRPGDDQQEAVDSEQAASTTAPSLAAGPPDQAALDALELRVEPVAGIENPTAVVEHPATGDLYIAAVAGAIVRVPGDGGSPAPVADLSGQISTSGESGLLDIAFDAGGDLLYVSLVASGGDLTLVEIPVSTDGLATERARTLLTVTSPTNVHHAGDVDVDAAGLVWYAVGDGGPSQAYNTRAQDLTDLHGKILRIDPRPAAGAAYQIPPDNPFAGRSDVRPEIWAYGLRNPWRFELDPVTSDLWIGDVGRNGPEEINHLPGPQAGAGANLGWPYFEGTTPGLSGAPAGLVGPVLEYPHDDRCGVTGGPVYRGNAIPTLRGAFVYTDLCDGIVRAISVSSGTVVAERSFAGAQAGYPVSFGTDLTGEMYLCSFDLDTVFRIVAE